MTVTPVVDDVIDSSTTNDAAASEPDVSARSARSRRPGIALTGVALCILSALLLSVVAELTLVGSLRHTRDQDTLYAEFRRQLAEATAPVGQVDSEGALLNAGAPVALLRIPRLGVEQVVVEGTTSTTLMDGPGHRRDTVLPGQAGVSVLFARQAAYGGPFGALGELVPGDSIQVVTGQGEFEFAVTGQRRPGDPQPPAPAAGDSRLTLVTADGVPYAPTSTLRVDADLTGDAAQAPARVIGPAALAEAERPMEGDPSAWIPLVFWAQGLLVAAIGVVWLRGRWGRWQTWVVGAPVLATVGLATATQVARLLPNLL